MSKPVVIASNPPEATDKTVFNWPTIIALAFVHVGALAAFFFIEWKAIAVAAVLYFLCISWGIGMGYHRLLTHRSYKVPRWIEYLFAVLGSMTLEGGPIFWVGTHRIHHQCSDQEGDPHSPRDGAWWSHIGWIILGKGQHNETDYFRRYAPDMTRNGFYVWLNTYHYVPLLISAALLFAWGGWPAFLWAGCLRVVVSLHSTWAVNSATHMWGKRRFLTKDDSRNNWWVALLTFGEGWHNNHHAKPNSARHGLAWYELDITWLQIKALGKLGIATGVKEASVRDADPEPARAAA
ncbi:MAG: fatty acid desaturase [Bryobacteraceae bacterium]